MKKIFSYITIAALAIVGLSSCETYKVKYAGETAVANMDGLYLCFAYDKSDAGKTNPIAFFELKATNTADDAADVMWFNMIDYRSANASGYRPEAVRFKVSCDTKAQTFSCSLSKAYTQEYIYNRIRYSYAYDEVYAYSTATTSKYAYLGVQPDYSVTITNGIVETDGVKTNTGYFADRISFNYTIAHEDGSLEEYVIEGMKNTGWPEDVAEYDEWIASDWGWL